jgi:uncharacterized protein (DUF1810 family)
MESIERFLDGQRFGYKTALAEMKQGEKRNHWIWYIFPQVKGLGHSPNAQYYGIKDLEEAKAYLQHPVLGQRLREITAEVLKHSGSDIETIMGSRIDALKFRSSMTLFDLVSPNDIFKKALATFFDGMADKRTLSIVGV